MKRLKKWNEVITYILYRILDFCIKERRMAANFSFNEVLIIAGSDEYYRAACLTANSIPYGGRGCMQLTAASALLGDTVIYSGEGVFLLFEPFIPLMKMTGGFTRKKVTQKLTGQTQLS